MIWPVGRHMHSRAVAVTRVEISSVDPNVTIRDAVMRAKGATLAILLLAHLKTAPGRVVLRVVT